MFTPRFTLSSTAQTKESKKHPSLLRPKTCQQINTEDQTGTEDFIWEFKDCKIFSKSDLHHGYHQFLLNEESRQIMTFSATWRNYRYKPSTFRGLNSHDHRNSTSPQQQRLYHGWRSGLERPQLRMLHQQIEDHSLTLRRENCEFGKTTVNFHGHLFTTGALKLGADQIKVVKDSMPPKTTKGPR